MYGAAAAMLALFVLLVTPAGAAAAGDVAAGEAAFQRCGICHNIAAGAGTKVGPDLFAIFGRKAGTAANFDYSAAMKNSGIVWNDKSLAEYLKNPHEFIPGNRMAFPGIKDAKEIADLLAYLHQAAQ
jgi:cytochrome c